MNFEFIKGFSEFSQLYNDCSTAEQVCLSNYKVSITTCRICNEYIIKFIYTAKVGDTSTLSTYDILINPSFKNAINNDTQLLNVMHYIRKMGNIAAHEDSSLTEEDSLFVLEDLHFLVGEFFISLGLINDYPEFVKPTKEEQKPVVKEEPKEEIEVDKESAVRYATRMKFVKFAKMGEEDYKLNSKKFLEACLTESHWPIVKKESVILPNSVTLNFALASGDKIDYTFTGSDNKPLAIVEYTLSSTNLFAGKAKVIKQAEELEQLFGYKPIVYYTDGYNIFCIDWLGFAPRRVFSFHSSKELELLILRRNIRTPIDNPQVDQNIVNRVYQNESVQKICEVFSNGRRRSLLVLATGTGKTRVSIAASDVLLKNNWVKNILFLADRKSLVHQAHKAYTKLLPSVTTSVFAGDSLDKNVNARVIFSTYQSLMPLINGEHKEFGVGRFDLIIIDEAHRSVFDKFGAIFSYFDALIIGLTATPKNEQVKSTYQVLQIDDEQPDYEYGLEKAVEEGYLVGFSVINRTTKLNERQFNYYDLSEEERAANESAFTLGADEDDPDSIEDEKQEQRKLSGRVINLPSIDLMINDLMKDGLKVEGGDKIGKTIIFAKSHFEAVAIVERFNKLYGSEYGDNFCVLIDSSVTDALNLIDKFSSRDSEPQIAVTVSLLDTGIDVPDILNLVFYKAVNSKIKFLQMIGRGTRLSKDIYGPGLDKNGFFIFDYYGNFKFFQSKGNWSTTVGDDKGKRKPVSSMYYTTQIEIAHFLYLLDEPTQFEQDYADSIKMTMFGKMSELINDQIQVQNSIKYVNKYRDINNWGLTVDKTVEEINERIVPLFTPNKDLYRVKIFDYSFFRVELSLLHAIFGETNIGFGHATTFIGKTLALISKLLLKKSNIPVVKAKESLIKELANLDNIKDLTVEQCEHYRCEIRDLIQYVDFPNYYYKFIISDELVVPDAHGTSQQNESYDKKLESYLKQANPIFIKLMTLQPLIQSEYDSLVYDLKQIVDNGDVSLLTKGQDILPFLRSKLGIEDSAIMTAFGHFLNSNILSEEELEFCNGIIDYAKTNGDFIPVYLQTVSPFCDKDITSLFGANMQYLIELINGIHNPIKEEAQWKS